MTTRITDKDQEHLTIVTTRIAVYTCITQGYDLLKVPLEVDNRFDYFCFTDDPSCIKPPWIFRPIMLPKLSPKDQNRYIKMHPHKFLPEYDLTLYIDGSIQMVGDISGLIETSLIRTEGIFLYRHPLRNCVYAEGAACSHIAHERIWSIAAQMRRYSKAGYPIENGLFEANVIIRTNTPDIRCFMDFWWEEYSAGAKRDQLSLPFVAWRLGVPLGVLGEVEHQERNKFFHTTLHSHKCGLKSALNKAINRIIALITSYRNLFGITAPPLWEQKLMASFNRK